MNNLSNSQGAERDAAIVVAQPTEEDRLGFFPMIFSQKEIPAEDLICFLPVWDAECFLFPVCRHLFQTTVEKKYVTIF